MISHLGAQLGVADGLALAQKLRNDKRCTLVFTGDGGASEGDFHESLNVAAVWQLPVLIVVENNQWGLSTPSSEQFVHGSFVNKGPAYGMEAHSVDGNDLIAVRDIAKQLTASIRENPRPILLECMTYRVRGHEEASGTKYYPEGMIDAWSEKDPLLRLRQSLNEAKLLTHNAMDAIDQSHSVQVLADLEQALTSKRPSAWVSYYYKLAAVLAASKNPAQWRCRRISLTNRSFARLFTRVIASLQSSCSLNVK